MEEHFFEGNVVICQWLCSAFVSKLLYGKTEVLDKQITAEVKAEIEKGDIFYLEAFRAGGFINEHTKENESPRPLYDVVNNIYNDIISNLSADHEKLIVYSELRHSLEEILGRLIAAEKSLQQYEVWKTIADEVQGEHNLFNSWVNAIPVSSINQEKNKFSVIPGGTKLSDLANIRGYGRNNEEEAANYLSHIAEAKSKPLMEYLHEACRSTDLLTFKDSIYLQQELLRKAGLNDWLLFIDSLVYLNLQDHIFLWVDELEEYTSIIQGISTVNLVITPKEHLLIIALENYFDFLDRTVSELYSLALKSPDTHNGTGQNDVIEAAKKEYSDWMEKYIPDSFGIILATLFPDAELEKNTFFNTFFDWLNSHTSLHYTHHLADCKTKLLDTLNEILIKRMSGNEEDVQHLVSNLKPHQINYESLKKLVTVLTDKKPASLYKDRLLNLYIDFIKSAKFSWYAEGNVDFASTINNTYYFSQVLNSFTDAVSKWESLFSQYKINHDGWLKSPSDYKDYQREAFILCAGIGMAYNQYHNQKQADGRKLIFTVLNLLLKQLRNTGDMASIDYLTPVKFASITIGELDKEHADEYLQLITEKSDKLKYILVALHDLCEYYKAFIPSEKLRHLIKKRISDEFWIIENKKSEAVLKGQLGYYTKLKTKALELCQ
ncbi:hypothetical protein [Ferruginibacter sp.]|nr:hypothetical protein [Ferruginibacter sp.]